MPRPTSRSRTRTRFFQRRGVLLALMVLLILAAAGIFLAVGAAVTPGARHEVSQLLASPKPSPTPRLRAYFAPLYQKRLDPKQIKPFVTGIGQPHGLGLFNGTLYVSSWDDQAIYKVDLGSGEKRILSDGLDGAHDMVMDKDGNLIVTLYGAGRLVRINPNNGTVKTIARNLDHPNGLAHARSGGYYVTNAGNGTLVKISPSGDVRTIASGLAEPAGIVVDNDNIVRVAQFANSADPVIQIQDNGKTRALVKHLTNAESLAVDSAKNLMISHVLDGKAAFSVFFARGEAPQLVLQTDLPGPAVGPVTDGQYLYFESAAPGQSTVYRIPLLR